MITPPDGILIKTYGEATPSEAEMDRLRRISSLTDTGNDDRLAPPQGEGGGSGRREGDSPRRSNIPHGHTQELQDALKIDARSIWVECPTHKGLLASLVDLKTTHRGDNGVTVWGQILCKYCGTYRFIRLVPGAVSNLPKFPWNE